MSHAPFILGNGATPQKITATGPFVLDDPVCKCAPITSVMLCFDFDFVLFGLIPMIFYL